MSRRSSGVIMEEGSAHSVRQTEPGVGDDMTRERRLKLVELFHKLNPPTYAGIEGSEAAEEFLKRAEKIFDLLECTSREKVVLATYSLQREADAWWEASRENVEREYVGDGWEQFRQAFLDKYFPFTVREDKAREFGLLQQTEGMSVDQYEAKFSKLSRYAPEMVDTPVRRARKFERGLLPRIQLPLAVQMLTNYGELYRRAQEIEKIQWECKEIELRKGKSVTEEGGSRGFARSVKRGRFLRRGVSSGAPRYSGYVQSTETMLTPTCQRCGRWHSGWACPVMSGGEIRCYQCGRPGHVRRDCPRNQGSIKNNGSMLSAWFLTPSPSLLLAFASLICLYIL